MSSDAQALEIDGVSNRYSDLVAPWERTFNVRAGERIVFVGRNGAGKTTTIRIVLGVPSVDEGTVRWGGVPLDFAAWRRIECARRHRHRDPPGIPVDARGWTV